MRDPRGPLILALGLLVVSLATTQPVLVLAALIGSTVLYLAAPVRHGLMLRIAAASGLLVLALNPFVAVEGDHVLLAGPHLVLLDLEVTSEELLYGLVAGMRLATAILATSAFLAHADPDRLQALVGRVAPRSALTVALAARLLPTLRRDATALDEALRLRGTGLAPGRRARITQAAALVEPLVGASLERGVGISEAMAARGYGGGAFTRLPEAPAGHADRLAMVTGVAILAAGAALVAGALPYAIYPIADPVAEPAALLLAGGIAAVAAVTARALRGAP